MDPFVVTLFAHTLGDFFFQPKKMAIEKTSPGTDGFCTCIYHCCIYALCFCALGCLATQGMVGWHIYIFNAIVFANHFVIDRWNLAQKWLNFIHGRNFIDDWKKQGPFVQIEVPFDCIVYTVVDNAMHLMINYYALVLLGGKS